VKVAVRFGWKARVDTAAMFAGPLILRDDLAYEIGGNRRSSRAGRLVHAVIISNFR
jgi:hypothetical protein